MTETYQPIGFERVVHAMSDGEQTVLAVAAISGDRFVALWRDFSGSLPLLRARLLDKEGAPLSGDIAIATLNNDYNSAGLLPELVARADGGFHVFWSEAAPGQSEGVVTRTRAFDAAGQALGPALDLPVADDFFQHVGARVGGIGTPREVVALADGGAAMVYSRSTAGAGEGQADVFATFVGPNGAVRVSPFAVAVEIAGEQGAMSVAQLTNGPVVVVWADASAKAPGAADPAAGVEIKGRLFGLDGGALGGEFIINATSAGDQQAPKIVALDGGGFVVQFLTFQPYFDPVFNLTRDVPVLRLQVFDGAGAKVGPERDLAIEVAGGQTFLDLVATGNGGFALAWSEGRGFPFGTSLIYRTQLFDAQGAAIGPIRSQTQPIDTLLGAADGSVQIVGLTADLLFPFATNIRDAYVRSLPDDGSAPGPLTVVSDVKTVSSKTYAATAGLNAILLYSGKPSGVIQDDVFARVLSAEPAIVVPGADELANTLFGTDAIESINGLGGDDVLLGGGGRDTVTGGMGSDFLFGGDGNDVLIGAGFPAPAAPAPNPFETDFDIAFGEGGDDRISQDGPGRLYAEGGAGSDSITGSSPAAPIGDTLFGGQGSDTIRGEGGDDVLLASTWGLLTLSAEDAQSLDRLFGGTGDDWLLQGDSGRGALDGGDGDDSILGGAYADTLSGGNGDDFLIGGAGDDVLEGSYGSDVLLGGAGVDTFRFETWQFKAGVSDIIYDFEVGDRISVGSQWESYTGAFESPGFGTILFVAYYPGNPGGAPSFAPIYLPGAAVADVRFALDPANWV